MAAFAGYCDYEDVTGHVTIFTGELSATSKPPLARVQEWISSAGIELNQALDALGYSTPVVEGTSPNAYAWLRDVNSLKPAAYLEMALSSAASAPNARGREADLLREYREQLKLLRAGEIKLSDAETQADVVLHEADDQPGHHLNDPYLALDEATDVGPQFRRDYPAGALEY